MEIWVVAGVTLYIGYSTPSIGTAILKSSCLQPTDCLQHFVPFSSLDLSHTMERQLKCGWSVVVKTIVSVFLKRV